MINGTEPKLGWCGVKLEHNTYNITRAHTSTTAQPESTFQKDRLVCVCVWREEVPDNSLGFRPLPAGDFRGWVCVVMRGDRGNASKTETVAQVQLSGSPLTSEGLLFPKVRHDYFYY